MENYFNYFTEIEDQYLRRRGGGLLLSTLDWALIETWKDAGIPLAAVLQGIDAAFDRYGRRPAKTKKINSLAFCSQEVLAAAEDMKEAAVGVAETAPAKSRSGEGFEPNTIAAFFRRNADILDKANTPEDSAVPVRAVVAQAAATLRQLAAGLETSDSPARLEDLERHLTVLEEKIFAALLTSAPDDGLVSVRAQADRELAPYRRNMQAAQVEQLQKQFVHKRLLEKYRLPRLSLFYM
ncbi:MAG TPA: hypothetical protein VND65_09145 [Candidatus Binatia bacterium]|nr:hypothetical protein [Candidatus Binatia bacterium]